MDYSLINKHLNQASTLMILDDSVIHRPPVISLVFPEYEHDTTAVSELINAENLLDSTIYLDISGDRISLIIKDNTGNEVIIVRELFCDQSINQFIEKHGNTFREVKLYIGKGKGGKISYLNFMRCIIEVHQF